MEGITILNSEIIMTSHWIPIVVTILGGIGLILSFLMDALSFNCDVFKMLIISTIITLIGVISMFIFKVPCYTSYEVILEDSVSINEFLNRYEILDQRGQIYVIKEIDE